MKDLLVLLAGMPDGVMVVDGKQRIVFWNRAAEALLGLSAQDALGRRCYEVVGCWDEADVPLCQRNCHTMALAKQTAPVPSSDTLARTKGGEPIWLHVNRVPLQPDRQEGAPVVHILRNVSHQRVLEQIVHQLSDSLASLAARSRPSKEFPDFAVPLSVRERQVLRLMADGMSTPGITGRLGISRATVKNHINHILSKLGVHTRLEAVTLAWRRRLF